MESFLSAVGGRKFGLVVLAMIAVVITGVALKVDGSTILDAIKWLTGIGVGGIAVEDGVVKAAQAIGGKTETKTP